MTPEEKCMLVIMGVTKVRLVMMKTLLPYTIILTVNAKWEEYRVLDEFPSKTVCKTMVVGVVKTACQLMRVSWGTGKNNEYEHIMSVFIINMSI